MTLPKWSLFLQDYRINTGSNLQIKRKFNSIDSHVCAHNGQDKTHDLSKNSDQVFPEFFYNQITASVAQVGQGYHSCKGYDYNGNMSIISMGNII